MRIMVTLIFFLFFCNACSVFSDEVASKGVYVRIVNSGILPVRSYIINEQAGRKSLQHFFPGLKPGDSTIYLYFKKLSTATTVTAIMDSTVISRKAPVDCSHCNVPPSKKATVFINVSPEKDGAAYIPKITVHYNY